MDVVTFKSSTKSLFIDEKCAMYSVVQLNFINYFDQSDRDRDCILETFSFTVYKLPAMSEREKSAIRGQIEKKMVSWGNFFQINPFLCY